MRPPAMAAMVLMAAVALLAGGLVVLSASGSDVSAAAQERAEYVPFLGETHLSCTWGSPSGVANRCRDAGAAYHPYKALDFQLGPNTPVLAAGAGVVTFAGPSSGGFGNAVLVYHAGDDRTSLYAHLSRVDVAVGARVLAGQGLGSSGNTGKSEGYHLHYAEAPGRQSRAWGRGGPGVDPGPMIGTQGGRRVSFPSAWGSGDWTRYNIEPAFNRHVIGRDRMPEVPGDWANHIVQWDGDTKTQKTSWLVSAGYLRNHIESSAQFFCLKASYPGPVKLPAATLDQLADQVHQPVTQCADRPAAQHNAEAAAPAPAPTLATLPPAPTPMPTLDTIPAAPVPPPAPAAAGAPVDPAGPPPADVAGPRQAAVTTATTAAPPTTSTTRASVPPTTAAPAPQTYPEQQGSRGADTFRNYHNASDKGARIEPNQWVEVSCKVYDPTIQSADPDGYWYRIASAPWNNQYYAVANTFWNGDTPGQTPYTHNTDFNVPDC